MIAGRYNRVVVLVDETDPFPARSARPIRLPRRLAPSAAVAIRAVQPAAGHNGGPKLVDENR